MGDERRRRDARPDKSGDEGDGGLLELLRRVVAPRQAVVLVMERDGQVRELDAER